MRLNDILEARRCEKEASQQFHRGEDKREESSRGEAKKMCFHYFVKARESE